MSDPVGIPVERRPYLTKRAVAELLGFSMRTVDRLPLPWAVIYPGTSTVMVARADLDKYMREQRGAVPE